MKNSTKKLLGISLASVMTVGVAPNSINIINKVNAAESEALRAAKAKIQHTIDSINKNYARLENQAQWEEYTREARELVLKIPSSENTEVEKLTKQIDGLEDTILAIAGINQVEKSYIDNYQGIKNADDWRSYLNAASNYMKSIDLSVFKAKYDELLQRYNNISSKVKEIEDAHYEALDRVNKLYNEAKESKKLEDAEKALAEAEKLGTHSTTDEIINKIKNLIKDINNGSGNQGNESEESIKDISIAVLPDNYSSDVEYTKYNGTTNFYGEAFKLNSNTLIVGEKAKLYKVSTQIGDDELISKESGVTVESSNYGVVSVSKSASNAKNLLKAESPGTAIITIKTGNVEKKITIKVEKKERFLNRVVLDKSSVTLSEDQETDIKIKTLDQYGDPIQTRENWFETSAENIYTSSGNLPIVIGGSLASNMLRIESNSPGKVGEGTLNIKASRGTKGESGLVQIKGSENSFDLTGDLEKLKGVTLATLKVNVTKNTLVSSYKLEVIDEKDYSNSFTLDKSDEKSNKLILSLNSYNSDGIYIGRKPFAGINDGEADSWGYGFKSLNSSVASVDRGGSSSSHWNSDEYITVTAKKEGKTTIVIKDNNGKIIAQQLITVVDDELTIENIDFKVVPTVTTSNKIIKLDDVLDVEKDSGDTIIKGITLTRSKNAVVRMADKNYNSSSNYIYTNELYVDMDNNGKYSEGDVKLGWLNVTVLDGDGIKPIPITTSYTDKLIEFTGNKASGTVIVKILKDKDNEKTSIGATSFKVKVES